MRRILYVLPYFELGGTERHVINLISQVTPEYQVTLLTPKGDGLELLSDMSEEFPVHHFPRIDKGLFSGISGFNKVLSRLVEEESFDLIHVHGAHELLLLAGRNLRGRVPMLFTNHGYHGDILNFSYRSSAWVCNRNANGVICVSDFEGEKMLKAGLSPSKLSVIHNGVAEDDLKVSIKPHDLYQRYPIPQDRVIIGTVARLVKFKGVDYLINAFQRVVEAFPETHLIIVGSGEEGDKLKEMAEALKISDNVTFTGYVKESLAMMSLFDIFVLPSLVEPFGMVCAEAMAVSKPVVASKVGGIPEIVIPDETGYLVMPGDISELALKIKELILDDEKRIRFGKNGRRRFQDNFTTKIMGQRTMDLYESLLS